MNGRKRLGYNSAKIGGGKYNSTLSIRRNVSSHEQKDARTSLASFSVIDIASDDFLMSSGCTGETQKDKQAV